MFTRLKASGQQTAGCALCDLSERMSYEMSVLPQSGHMEMGAEKNIHRMNFWKQRWNTVLLEKGRRDHIERRRAAPADRLSDRMFRRQNSREFIRDRHKRNPLQEKSRSSLNGKSWWSTQTSCFWISTHRRCEAQALTGQTNENILDMARALHEIGNRLIRHVLVPERTDDDESSDDFRFPGADG